MSINDILTKDLEDMAHKVEDMSDRNNRRKNAIKTLEKHGYIIAVYPDDPDDYRPAEYKLTEKAKELLKVKDFEY